MAIGALRGARVGRNVTDNQARRGQLLRGVNVARTAIACGVVRAAFG